MTLSPTRGAELTVDQILTSALHLSGLLDTGQPADEADLAYGRRTLDTVMDSLQAEGVYARSVPFFELALTAGEPYYAISSDILDLVGDGAYIDAANTSTKGVDGETPVKQIDRESWQRLSAKGAEGRPSQYYLHRAEVPLQVRLWPTPDEAGTIRFQAQTLVSDTEIGSSTPDARVFWNQYFTWEMAHHYATAKSLPVQTRSYLNKRAMEYGRKARSFANQGGNNFLHLDHANPWRGR